MMADTVNLAVLVNDETSDESRQIQPGETATDANGDLLTVVVQATSDPDQTIANYPPGTRWLNAQTGKVFDCVRTDGQEAKWIAPEKPPEADSVLINAGEVVTNFANFLASANGVSGSLHTDLLGHQAIRFLFESTAPGLLAAVGKGTPAASGAISAGPDAESAALLVGVHTGADDELSDWADARMLWLVKYDGGATIYQWNGQSLVPGPTFLDNGNVGLQQTAHVIFPDGDRLARLSEIGGGSGGGTQAACYYNGQSFSIGRGLTTVPIDTPVVSSPISTPLGAGVVRLEYTKVYTVDATVTAKLDAHKNGKYLFYLWVELNGVEIPGSRGILPIGQGSKEAGATAGISTMVSAAAGDELLVRLEAYSGNVKNVSSGSGWSSLRVEARN